MFDTLPRILLTANLAATLFMTGLIWFVQVVHYPLFASTGRDEFQAYERRHQALTTWVVAPPMLVELLSSMLLLWFRPPGISIWLLLTGAALVALIWVSTALVQVPCHGRLSQNFDLNAHRRLVRTNWVRTIAWTLRGILVLGMSGLVAN